ncbi:MFS transporter [Christensenellaceae bacterium OttesenSCG-928-M15]|nr:MFS transporter [Christensenellaceae bacterium OttesenSCG-928-M15]
MEKKKRFTKPESSWMMYDWANSAYSILIAAVLPLYASAIASLNGVSETQHVANWGYASSVTGLIVAVLAPILGSIADYRSQRMRFFAAFFIVGVLSTGLLTFSSAYIPLLILYGVTHFGFAGANVFYDAFLVDVTTPERMDKISTWGYAVGYIGGSTIPFLVSIALIMFGSNFGVDEVLAMRISCMITAIWWTVFTIPFFRHVRQHTFIEREPHMIKNSLKRLKGTFKAIRHYKYMFLFLIAYFFYIDGVGTIIKMATTYADALHLDMVSIILGLLITQIVAFPSSIIYGNLSAKYSAKRLLQFGILTYFAVCIVAFTMEKAWQFYLLATLVGTAQGGIQALSRSYFGKLIEDKQRSGEFFGLYNIFGKFESVMGTALMGIVVTATGNVHLGVIPIMVSFAVGFILLLFVPDDKKLAKK